MPYLKMAIFSAFCPKCAWTWAKRRPNFQGSQRNGRTYIDSTWEIIPSLSRQFMCQRLKSLIDSDFRWFYQNYRTMYWHLQIHYCQFAESNWLLWTDNLGRWWEMQWLKAFFHWMTFFIEPYKQHILWETPFVLKISEISFGMNTANI